MACSMAARSAGAVAAWTVMAGHQAVHQAVVVVADVPAGVVVGDGLRVLALGTGMAAGQGLGPPGREAGGQGGAQFGGVGGDDGVRAGAVVAADGD